MNDFLKNARKINKVNRTILVEKYKKKRDNVIKIKNQI